MKPVRARVIALISGRGSNLQAIIDRCADGSLAVDLAGVISDRPDAAGLARAHAAGLQVDVCDHRDYPTRAAFDTALAARVDSYRPTLIVLAGFMRILTAPFVNRYRGRLLNIHPSLLPAFRGLDTHARALAAGVSEHGASVHFVTPALDGGPVIAQARVAVEAADTPDSLAARVLRAEHRLYPQTLAWFAAGRLALSDGRVLFDGHELTAPLRLDVTRDAA